MCTIPVVAWIANAAACLAAPYGAVAERARLAGCSRQAVYDQARKVRAAVAAAYPDGPSREQLIRRRPCRSAARIDELWRLDRSAVEVAPGQRQRFAVTAAAMGLSTTQIRGLLALILGAVGGPLAVGTIGRWTAAAGVAAGRVLARLDAACRSLILVGCLDEIFFHGRPVLVGDRAGQHDLVPGREGRPPDGRETWARALRACPALRHVVADAGSAPAGGRRPGPRASGPRGPAARWPRPWTSSTPSTRPGRPWGSPGAAWSGTTRTTRRPWRRPTGPAEGIPGPRRGGPGAGGLGGGPRRASPSTRRWRRPGARPPAPWRCSGPTAGSTTGRGPRPGSRAACRR